MQKSPNSWILGPQNPQIGEFQNPRTPKSQNCGVGKELCCCQGWAGNLMDLGGNLMNLGENLMDLGGNLINLINFRPSSPLKATGEIFWVLFFVFFSPQTSPQRVFSSNKVNQENSETFPALRFLFCCKPTPKVANSPSGWGDKSDKSDKIPTPNTQN